MEKRCSARTLRAEVQALVSRYEAQAQAIREEAYGCGEDPFAGYRALGRADVLHEIALHLRDHLRRSVLLVDLAQSLVDVVGCAEKSELDEENEAEEISTLLRSRSRKCHRAAQQEKRLRAVGRAQAYAEVQEQVNKLLAEVSVEDQDSSGVPVTLDVSLEEAPLATETHERCKQNISLLLFSSFSPLPEMLPVAQRGLLNDLEQSLLAGRQRILVETPHDVGPLDLLFASLDRLLRSPLVRRVLIIPGSGAQALGIRRHYATYRSAEDGHWFADLYPAQDALTTPLAEGTRVCFASIRQVQVCLPNASASERLERMTRVQHILSPGSFDIVVVYGELTPSPLWYKVLAYFRAVVICLSLTTPPHVQALFSDLISREDECMRGWPRISVSRERELAAGSLEQA